LSRASYRAAFGDPDAPLFQDVLFPELWGAGAASAPLDAAAIRRELEALEHALRIVGERLTADPKVSIVARAVKGLRARRGLVFTQSRDTAKALWSTLRADVRCGLVTGSGCRDVTGTRAPMADVLAMLARGAIDVVVATDVGCEGLDLQAAAWVIHADLPWSPAKLEQRLGRVGRIGQRAARIEEIVTVAQGSPVALALARKTLVGARFSPRRGESPTVAVPARIEVGQIAESDDESCVVDVAERRAGRTARALRAIGVAGNAGSLREGRMLALEMQAFPIRDGAGISAAVDDAVIAWVETVRAREVQPPRLDATSPQFRLLEATARAGLVTPELVGLLSRRYRSGTELLIGSVLEGATDERAVSALMRALGGEASVDEPYDAKISGFVVARGWLRSASLLRRRRG
jgi:hypothetical protein